jgi:hypothetical protein
MLFIFSAVSVTNISFIDSMFRKVHRVYHRVSPCH